MAAIHRVRCSRVAHGLLLFLALNLGVARARSGSEWFPFVRGDWTVEANGIYGIGENAFGGKLRHDFALANFQVGYFLTDRVAQDRFYSGALELTGQVWGGVQVDPDDSCLAGIMPGIRYHFFTGMRLVPYVGLNAGILLTDMGEPDLGSDYQFNQQYALGVHWFFHEHWALNTEYRAMHISNAGIERPNQGVNDHLIVLGLLHKF